MGYAKWIGGALGWVMFGPIGGIIGYFIGAGMDKDADKYSGSTNKTSVYQAERNSFLVSLLVLSTAVIKADGRTTSAELAKVREFFSRNFGPQAGEEAVSMIQRVLQQNYNLYEVCGQIRSNMDYPQRMQLYHYLVSLADSDGLVQSEIDILEVIATYIGLTKSDADSIIFQFRPDNESNYRILGISPSATNDQVRKAYRQMAVKYHPDKVSTLGHDVQKAAEDKFKAVSQAYESICKERGM